MSSSKTYWTIGGIVLAVIIIAALSFALRHRTLHPSQQSETASTTASGNSIVIRTANGGTATITELPDAPAPIEPSLNRPLTFEGSALPPDAQVIVKGQMQALIASLKKDPTQLNMWIQLGIDYKMAGDYEGARQAWMYVNELAPEMRYLRQTSATSLPISSTTIRKPRRMTKKPSRTSRMSSITTATSTRSTTTNTRSVPVPT